MRDSSARRRAPDTLRPMWGEGSPLVAIGAMRLSTDPARDEAGAVATLHAAFDAGVTLVDTADAYALDAEDAGHNERLVARALATWSDPSARIQVITKGGLTRPGGQWVPDGRARHLRSACLASRAALGVPCIPLYQLHTPDPRVPLETSLRALHRLQQEEQIGAIGLCNVTVRQIEHARAVAPIATVQVELSPWKERIVAGGVLEYCLAHDIRLLAYRPFGGAAGVRRIASDTVLREIAAAHGASPFAVVLAWLRAQAPHIVPLPGPTRAATARDCAASSQLTLSDAERTTLNQYFPAGRACTPAQVRPRAASIQRDAGEDVVMVMGLPGAGKTTFASSLAAQGYERLNRDEAGGSLAALVPKLEDLLERGVERIVLDNTYLSRAARAAVIRAAHQHGRRVRGVWLDTSIEDAQVNVTWRMLEVHGRLLAPEELRAGGGPDRLTPAALFRAQREIELPEASEGFAALERVAFARSHDPALNRRAIVLWCDGVIRPARGPAGQKAVLDEATVAAREARLERCRQDGWSVCAISWEPEITEGGATAADVDADMARLRERLGLLDIVYCPHGGGPPICWCRKPLPGLGVLPAHRHRLDLSRSIYVGRTPQDPVFARRLGMQYRSVDEFFA